MKDEPHPDLFSTARMFRAEGTSAHAAGCAAEKARKEGTHKRIWLALDERPRTADQIAISLRMERNTARARISELLSAGWIEPTGETRPTAAGKPAEVWKTVDRCEPWPATFQKTKKTPKAADPAERDPQKELSHAV